MLQASGTVLQQPAPLYKVQLKTPAHLQDPDVAGRQPRESEEHFCHGPLWWFLFDEESVGAQVTLVAPTLRWGKPRQRVC